MRRDGSTAPGNGAGIFTGQSLSSELSRFEVMLASATLS
jgi:hypothetical protein